MSNKQFNEILDYGLEPNLKSKFHITVYTLLAFCAILFGVYLSYYFISKSFSSTFVISDFSIGSIILFLTLTGIFNLIASANTFFFYPNYIIKSNIFGKKKLENIHGFGLRKGQMTDDPNEHAILIDIIVILYEYDYVVLDSSSYSNFYTTKKFLENNFNDIGEEAFVSYDRRNSNLILIGVAVFILVFSIFFYGKEF